MGVSGDVHWHIGQPTGHVPPEEASMHWKLVNEAWLTAQQICPASQQTEPQHVCVKRHPMGTGPPGIEASGAFGCGGGGGATKHGGVPHTPPLQKNWLLGHTVSQPPQ